MKDEGHLNLEIPRNLKAVQRRIAETCARCGRDLDAVRLVCVTKTMSAETVRLAIQAGATLFGENYIQEAREKCGTLADYPVLWHFIGHLQTNKAKYAVKLFDLIHTVDSLHLATELDREARKIGKVQKILIQVNIGKEASKSGIDAESAETLLRSLAAFPNLSVRGLMVIPPFFDEPERVRPYFRGLRELRDSLNKPGIGGINLDELSMGMTGDFEAAIEEGATLVRIGTAIFGERQ
ncbi:MAG: YggS family pyridoxal phosphate-dependent enzyme [Deltaproteobacteria bacterium]|nr:YggS family pyridoxal phosphate-dependent enzyme [Deltaproteobacteria bacterium]